MTSKTIWYALILLIVTTLLTLIPGAAQGLTWEGELDPTKFPKWDIIETRMINSTTMLATAQNPDKNAKIQRIQMTFHINLNGQEGILVSYRYFKNGEIYNYEANADMNGYERRRYTDKERRGCMTCHPEIGEKI